MNNWIPKNKTVKLAVAVASVSLVLYLAGLFVVFMETKKVENLYNDTESESSKSERFLALKSIFETNQEPIQNLRSFFIQKGDEVKFIETIEDTSKNSGIKFEIGSIDVATGKNSSTFKEDVAVRVNIEGSWKSVVSFIDKLEKLPFEVSINDINLDASTPGHWSGSVEFVVFREK
jgi:hypothetical protein